MTPATPGSCVGSSPPPSRVTVRRLRTGRRLPETTTTDGSRLSAGPAPHEADALPPPIFRGPLWPHSPNNRSDAPSCAQNCAGFLWRFFHGIPRLHCCSFTPPFNGRQMGYGRKGMAPTTRAMTVGQGARFPYVVCLARAPHGAGRAGTARCRRRTRRFPCFFYRRCPHRRPPFPGLRFVPAMTRNAGPLAAHYACCAAVQGRMTPQNSIGGHRGCGGKGGVGVWANHVRPSADAPGLGCGHPCGCVRARTGVPRRRSTGGYLWACQSGLQMRQRLMVKRGREVFVVVVWWCAVSPLPREERRCRLRPTARSFSTALAVVERAGPTHARSRSVGRGALRAPRLRCRLPAWIHCGHMQRGRPLACLPRETAIASRSSVSRARHRLGGGGTVRLTALYESRQRVPHGRCLVATSVDKAGAPLSMVAKRSQQQMLVVTT